MATTERMGVDPLAVMLEVAEQAAVGDFEGSAADLLDARAAVAELASAADCFTCAIAEDSSYRDDLLSGIRAAERDSFMASLNRIRAALAPFSEAGR